MQVGAKPKAKLSAVYAAKFIYVRADEMHFTNLNVEE